MLDNIFLFFSFKRKINLETTFVRLNQKVKRVVFTGFLCLLDILNLLDYIHRINWHELYVQGQVFQTKGILNSIYVISHEAGNLNLHCVLARSTSISTEILMCL